MTHSPAKFRRNTITKKSREHPEKSPLILEFQAIGAGYIVSHRLRNNFLDEYRNFIENEKWRAFSLMRSRETVSNKYGMSVNWQSIEALKGLGIDLWILVPTGLGVNRLLKNHGGIPMHWMQKLEKFLGIGKDEILAHFYRQGEDLFGNEISEKSGYAVNKVGELYRKRLKEVFKFVSDSFVMRNSNNTIMYHFMMATNNAVALKIANDVIKPKYTF